MSYLLTIRDVLAELDAVRAELDAVRAERDALIQLGTRHGAWTPDTIRDEVQALIQATECREKQRRPPSKPPRAS